VITGRRHVRGSSSTSRSRAQVKDPTEPPYLVLRQEISLRRRPHRRGRRPMPVGATADGSRADDRRCCIPASGPLAGPRGRRCSSVEGAYPNAGGAVPLEDPLTGRRSDSVIGEGPDRGLHPPYREWPAIASGPVTPGEVPPTAHLVTPSRATPNVLIWTAATNRQADFMPALNRRAVAGSEFGVTSVPHSV